MIQPMIIPVAVLPAGLGVWVWLNFIYKVMTVDSGAALIG